MAAFICTIIKKQQDGKQLSINSQHKFLTDVKLFLRRLYQRKLISDSSFESFEMPRCQKRLPRAVLSRAEVELIFRMPMLRGDDRGIRDRAILELYYASAIRRSELVRLTLDHIDLISRVISVIEAKGMKDRWIPISQRACNWLDRYIKEVRYKHLTLDSEGRLFINAEGEPMKSDYVGQMVGKYIRRSGVNKPGACHLFRHSVATSMLDNGADLRYVQELLGHADISTTQIYTHVSIEKLKSVYLSSHPSSQ
ncbi:MAG: tyrosine-type recombinase/integrase [Pseudomonadales bacterium]|nr:tyrosine-type recombinase/integrase [Pseudomonadales bacterium]